MTSPTKIFMLGVTGYIGGTVLDKLLENANAISFEITVLVRNAKKAEGLKAFGVIIILGSLSDVEIIENQASKADVVIALADCDDVPSAEAILRGAKRKYDSTGKQPIFINTSGTGVLSVDTKGLKAADKIYDDMNIAQMASLPITQMHRPVDLAIVNADTEGYVKTYIILPSTIYGIAQTRFTKAGVQNPFSIQLPSLINASLDRKQAGMVGLGKNLWPNVEVHELSTLYTLLYDAAVKPNSTAGHGIEGYYFGANGEHSLLQVGKAIGKALVKTGRAQTDEVTTFTQDELDKYFGGSDYLGSTSRCVANRSKALGWKPMKTTEDMLKSLEPEMEAIVATRYNPLLH